MIKWWKSKLDVQLCFFFCVNISQNQQNPRLNSQYHWSTTALLIKKKGWEIELFSTCNFDDFECENEMTDLIGDLILCDCTARSDDHFIAHRTLRRHRRLFLRRDQLQQNLLSQIDSQENETSTATEQSRLFDNFRGRKLIWNNQRNRIAVSFAKSSKINRSSKIKIKIKITSFSSYLQSNCFSASLHFQSRREGNRMLGRLIYGAYMSRCSA